MKRRFFEREVFPLHISGKSAEGSWPTDQPETWDIFGTVIDELQQDHQLFTHSFVLMDNHYHWLCSFYDYEKDNALFTRFHERIRLEYLHRHLYIAQIFETDPTEIVTDNIVSYQNTYRYIYQNPVTAALCARVEDYEFSTLPSVLGHQDLAFVCHDNMNLIYDSCRILSWLNGEVEFGKSGYVKLDPYMIG